MERRPHPLKEIVDFQMSDDGKKFAVRLVTADGPTLDIEIPAIEMGALVRFFVMNAAELAKSRPVNEEESDPAHGQVTPIPTQAIGLAQGAVHSEPLLIVQLFGFDLGFEVPITELSRLSAEFSQASLLMSADVTRPQ
ncbi:MAG TPA: hypothetical protein VGF97_15680 [Rhizomicrobium sp.]|jgi:hypothetical protein